MKKIVLDRLGSPVARVCVPEEVLRIPLASGSAPGGAPIDLGVCLCVSDPEIMKECESKYLPDLVKIKHPWTDYYVVGNLFSQQGGFYLFEYLIAFLFLFFAFWLLFSVTMMPCEYERPFPASPVSASCSAASAEDSCKLLGGE